MRLTHRITKDDLRRDALYASQRRGRQVSKLRILYRTTVWLIWGWLLPILGIMSLLFHLVWIPYFQPISSAISLAEAKTQSVSVAGESSTPTQPLLPTPLQPIDQPLPLIFDFCISGPNLQNLNFCISKPITQEKP